MARSNTILRLVLTAAIAAVGTPVAWADAGFPVTGSKSDVPDAIDRYMRNHAQPAPLDECDLVCRYLRNDSHWRSAGGQRSPDTRTAGRTTKPQAGSHSGRVPRSYPPFRPADV
jgi:hypothetical protein